MGKYGNGVSMKSVVEMEMEIVEKVLDRYKMKKSDRRVITKALKNAYYLWCSSNAHACLFSDLVEQTYGKEEMDKLCKMSIQAYPYIVQKMEETYPYYNEDFFDDDDEEDEEK